MRLDYAYVFSLLYSALRPCTVRDVVMEIVDVLTALLARDRFITCAAPEFIGGLNVSMLRAEVRNKYGTLQRRIVMLLRREGCRRLSSANTFGSILRDTNVGERLGCIEDVAHRIDVLRCEEQSRRRSARTQHCNRSRVQRSLMSLRTNRMV